MTRKTIKVDYLARVEGESGLKVTIEEGVVKNAQLNIFEPPRFLKPLCGGATTLKRQILSLEFVAFAQLLIK